MTPLVPEESLIQEMPRWWQGAEPHPKSLWIALYLFSSSTSSAVQNPDQIHPDFTGLDVLF